MSALWRIGDILASAGVTKPHAIGMRIQEITSGNIKRPTVFRGFKARIIWKSIAELTNEAGELRSIQSFIDMLPVIDPQQDLSKRLSASERVELFEKARQLPTSSFAVYLRDLKSRISGGRLGVDRRTKDELRALMPSITFVRALVSDLAKAVDSDDDLLFEKLRNQIPLVERKALANMAIAIASKANIALYRPDAGPLESSAKLTAFSETYALFKAALRSRDDRERARLRRLIASSDFEALATRLPAIASEDARRDYKARSKLSVSIS